MQRVSSELSKLISHPPSSANTMICGRKALASCKTGLEDEKWTAFLFSSVPLNVNLFVLCILFQASYSCYVFVWKKLFLALSYTVQTIKTAYKDVIFLKVSQINLSQFGMSLSNRSLFKEIHAKIGHTQSVKLQGIHQLGASDINFQTWHGEHARTREIQLIYIATARFSPIQSKIQSVGSRWIFTQFIPHKMPQFSLWAFNERERKHQCVWRRNLWWRLTNRPNHLTWQTPTTTKIEILRSSFFLLLHLICNTAVKCSFFFQCLSQVNRQCRS